MYGYVYKTTNLINGNIWISNGQQCKMIHPEHFEEYAKQGYVNDRGGWSAYGKSSSKI